MLRQYELVERVKAYDPTADEGLLNRAYVFTVKAHGAQLRHSGDPYFSHPVEVAGILTDLKLDSATIITALLHDVIEDTTATPEEIETLFGADVARLVDGVTKLSRVEWSSEATKQAENFRKLLIAMSSDIRVLLVKLADRLHNMRTLRFIPKAEKRKRIAQETMEIYAPLADRMGMHEIREELEDLAFAELNPDARLSIMSRLAFLKEQGGDVVQRISDQIKRTLAQQGLDAWVIGREKRPFSIWHKMERKSVSFEALADIIGFRIVVKEASDCYRALGILHGTWPAVPLRFKDYVSLPKRNGYRSLHTTIIGPEGHRIEIQIRTLEMHEIAERGVAAHWSYKDYVSADPSRAGNPYNFLRELVEMLEHGGSAEEFLEHTKLEMFQDQVFCFTPKGDLIALPRGASAIDFAYAVHTEVGDTCVGAKINGRAMPLRTILTNGDSVEIIRSKAQHPLPSWSSLVVTGKARSAIRRFTRLAEREEFSRLGKGIVERVFRDAGYEATEKVLEPLLPQFKQPKLLDLYAAVGRGTLPPESVLEAVLGEGGANGKGRKSRLPRMLRRGKGVNGAHAPAIPIRGLSPGLAMHMSPCCHPLPGERIVGIKLPG
jgi:GTP pyrophosphokinase